MKNIFLFLLIVFCEVKTFAQGTIQIASGTNIKTNGNVFIVLDNVNLINNGSYVQDVGEGTTKLTGNTNTSTSGTGTTTLDKMEVAINSGFGNTLSSMVNLKNVLSLTSGQLLSNGNLTLKSDALNTARVAPITGGSVTGNIIVERYNSNKRSWRLLGVPFSASPGTIKASWMEGNTSPAGYGTQITTFAGDANAANFDAQKPASSIRIYAADNFNSDAAHTPNTTNIITANRAYFLFVRGDRTIDRTTAGAPSSNTTLRISGTFNQGNLSATGITGTGFSLITNPYPSPIDFDALKTIAANNSINTFYVWDASLGSVGQYRTVQISGSAAPYSYTATPGSTDANWRFIESGIAFFVAGNRTVDFTETTKSSGVPPSSMLRTTTNTEPELAVNLYTINNDNTTTLDDGIREIFNNVYSPAIDVNDAKKNIGFDLNLGISSNSDVLAVEKRPMPKGDDVIVFKLWNNTSSLQGNYEFDIVPNNFPATLTPYLLDNYLNTRTFIDQSSTTKINFTVTSEAASAASNRFSIVFTKPATFNANPSIVIYPNPVNNNFVSLQFTNMPKGIYAIKLLNTLGQTVTNTEIYHAEGSSKEILKVNKLKGAYMLEIIKPDKTKTVDKIIIN